MDSNLNDMIQGHHRNDPRYINFSISSKNRPNGTMNKIPYAQMGQLSEIKSLLLEGNNLTHISPEIGQLTSLEFLDLSHNPLYEIPEEIGNLINLKSFIANDTVAYH